MHVHFKYVDFEVWEFNKGLLMEEDNNIITLLIIVLLPSPSAD